MEHPALDRIALAFTPKKVTWLGFASVLVSSVTLLLTAAASTATERWLEVRRLSGNVMTQVNQPQPAQIGDRLIARDHGITTENRSSANLAIDLGIGFLAVAQNTQMSVQRLEILGDGSRVTVLEVPRGQVRIQARRFTHRQSRLELHTPSGIAAVRGTEFGVAVSADGKTSVATLTGQVEAIAQSVTVLVNANQVSIIRPGEVPTPPQPLDRVLDILWQVQERRGGRLYLSGFIDSANLLWRDGREITTNDAGFFETSIALPDRHQSLVFTVQNPLGEVRDHRLVPWQLQDVDGRGIRD